MFAYAAENSFCSILTLTPIDTILLSVVRRGDGEGLQIAPTSKYTFSTANQ